MQNNESKPEFPDGILYMPSRAAAPEWADGKIIIYPKKFGAWLKANPNFLQKYNGDDQIVLDINKAKASTPDAPKGYAIVNTYKPEETATSTVAEAQEEDDIFG